MMRRNLPRRLDREAHRVERREEQAVGLLGRDELRRDDRDLLRVGGDRAGQQELLARDRRDPRDQIAELRVGLHVELDDPLARRELLAGVELLFARRLGRARDDGIRRASPSRASASPASAATGIAGSAGSRRPNLRAAWIIGFDDRRRRRADLRGVAVGADDDGGARPTPVTQSAAGDENDEHDEPRMSCHRILYSFVIFCPLRSRPTDRWLADLSFV